MPTQTSSAPACVLILGGGFGGRYAARRLAALASLGRHPIEITLIDRNPYMLYTPMLTEVAGRSVAPGHIAAPVAALPRSVHFLQAEIRTADLKARTVTLANGRILQADHILIALGSTTNFRGIEGAEANSITMKTLDDARRARTEVQRNVELAARTQNPAERSRLLTIVIAGGGYTGVETIASINDLAVDTARTHGIASAELSLILIEPGKALMAEMPPALGAYGRQQLEASGIRVLLGESVTKVDAGTVYLTNNETLHPGLLIWDTGITPSPLIDTLNCPKGSKHGILTTSTFAVPGLPGIWAIGDCAEIPKPTAQGKFFEPTAQNATREGSLAAHNIHAALTGRPTRPFRYKQVGELALVSRYTGVANVFGVEINGFLAWLLWRGIYLAKMPGIPQRLGILYDWLRLALRGRNHVPTTFPLPRNHTEAQGHQILEA